jgi:isoquinoline 1-oxidoreductase beta subunit
MTIPCQDPARRRLLGFGAALGGGLIVGVDLFPQPAAASSEPSAFQPSAFLRVEPGGAVTVFIGQSEMGQGILTGLAQVVAEELDVDWENVRFEQAPTDPAFNHPGWGIQATGGSASVQDFWEPLRKAGATARSILVAAAAESWHVDPGACRTSSGEVIHPNGIRLGYGQLADRAAAMPEPLRVALKDPRDFKIIGQSKARLDTPAKVDGSARFGIDVRLPGMLVAVVARAPVVGGKLVSYDDAKARAVPGVRHVVRIASGVAVVADGFWAAKSGRDVLQTHWDEGAGAGLSTDAIRAELGRLLDSPGLVALREGDSAAVTAGRWIEADYEVPYLAHACMEPMNATAWVRGDRVEVWAPTESPGLDRGVLAKVAGVDAGKVEVHTTLLGGGFGRRFAQDFSTEAVQVSKALGFPVQVIYTREDDMKAQYYRPAARARLGAAQGASGRPVAFTARVACSSIDKAAGFKMENGIDGTAVEGLMLWPYGSTDVQIEWAPYENGIVVWFLRSVGYSQNAFFAESFIDELAHAAGRDPVEYRRSLLGRNPRLRAVLDLAAEKSGWGQPAPAGRARGVAVNRFRGTFVAQVVEVSLAADGRPCLHRVTCAVDCGQVINPGIVRQQVEGGVVFALSAALYGQITLRDGRVEQANFDDYRVLRIGEMPQVEVAIVPSDERPTGIGETAVPPLAPAIANALYTLTGKRVRSQPFGSIGAG